MCVCVSQRLHVYYHYGFRPLKPFWGPNSIMVAHMEHLGRRVFFAVGRGWHAFCELGVRV